MLDQKAARFRTSLFVVTATLVACGDKDDSGGANEPIDPTADCVAYLRCANAADSSNADLYESAYGAGSECWIGSAQEALACTSACQDGLETMGMANPTVSECWPTESPEARWLFGTHPAWVYDSVMGDCYDATATFGASSAGPDFGMSILWATSGAYWTLACTLDADFAFACDSYIVDDYEKLVTGSFDADLSGGTMTRISRPVGSSDTSDKCVFEAVPAG
jgi:hypothetical protein